MDSEIQTPKKTKLTPKLITRLLLTTAIFWLPAILFVALANEVLEHEPPAIDTNLLLWIHQYASAGLDKTMVFVTTLGDAIVVVPAVLLATGILAVRRYQRQAAFLLLTAGSTAVINQIFKHVFQRERPDLWHWIVTEHGYSFPSGHAMMSAALALSIIILCWQTRYRWVITVAAAMYAIVIGVSRLYLGVHYPTDVLGGWIVSILWVSVVYKVFNRYNRR